MPMKILAAIKKYLISEDMNKNLVATGHNEFKDIFLNNKCIRHSMNIIYNKMWLFCFNGRIYIQNNSYDESALGYQS